MDANGIRKALPLWLYLNKSLLILRKLDTHAMDANSIRKALPLWLYLAETCANVEQKLTSNTIFKLFAFYANVFSG